MSRRPTAAYERLRARYADLIVGETAFDPAAPTGREREAAAAAAGKVLYDLAHPAHRADLTAWLAAGGVRVVSLCCFDVYETHTPPGRSPRLTLCGQVARWCRETSAGSRHMFACNDHRERIARDAAWYEETVVAVDQLT